MYAPVSALRSTRFPLAGGLGCPCSAPVAGLGQLLPAVGGVAAGVTLTLVGGTGLVLGYFVGKHAQKRGLALNRGRRSRRRR